jgi:hypothetical protein
MSGAPFSRGEDNHKPRLVLKLRMADLNFHQGRYCLLYNYSGIPYCLCPCHQVIPGDVLLLSTFHLVLMTRIVNPFIRCSFVLMVGASLINPMGYFPLLPHRHSGYEKVF